jgi:hypothetical protein
VDFIIIAIILPNPSRDLWAAGLVLVGCALLVGWRDLQRFGV